MPEPDHLTVHRLAALLAADLVMPAVGPVGDELLDPALVSVDSRQLSPGSVFFALSGHRRHGADFIEAAFAAGASCAISDQAPPMALSRPLLVVPSPLAALQHLAAWRRSRLTAKVVAIAGTFGKTTVKDALAAMLASEHDVYASPGSFNSQIGVPLALLRIPDDVQFGILELAATEPGEMERLVEFVRPDYAVLTNVAERQRTFFESIERQRAELSLVGRHLPPAGWLLAGQADDVVRASLAPGAVVHSADIDSPIVETVLQHRLEESNMAVSDFLLEIDGRVAMEVPRCTRERLSSVKLAVMAARLLGARSWPERYAPTVTTVKTWHLAGRSTIVRLPTSDDRMIWRSQLARVLQMGARRAHLVIAVTDPLQGISTDTIGAVLGALEEGVEICATGPAADKLVAAGVKAQMFAAESGLSDHLRSLERTDAVIAIFGPKTDDLEAVASRLFDSMGPSKLYISEDAIRSNIERISRNLSGKSAIMAVVKGGGYGANSTAMSEILDRGGIDHFAVATVDEGVDLRVAGLRKPILSLLPSPGELAKAGRHRLAVALQSDATLASAIELGAACPPVHLDVDTGMRRTGLAPNELPAAVAALQGAGVEVAGLMTHLASADSAEHDTFTLTQLHTFEACSRVVQEILGRPVVRHALNTPGSLRFAEFQYEYVRIGIGLLGIGLTLPEQESANLEPAVTLISEIIAIRDLEPGDRVGYGCAFTADGPRRSAVVPLGYYDGLPRSFSGAGTVLVNGQSCPVLGRVNMDSIVIDVTAAPAATVGSSVLVFGSYDGWVRPIEEAAEQAGTIPYELLARIGPRVQRIFVEH